MIPTWEEDDDALGERQEQREDGDEAKKAREREREMVHRTKLN